MTGLIVNGPVCPVGNFRLFKVPDPQTGKAVDGCWPVTGNVCDQPKPVLKIKMTKKAVFTIVIRQLGEHKSCRRIDQYMIMSK